MRSRGVLVSGLMVRLSTSHEHEHDYVKFPLYDGYVRSCSQKEENFGFEQELEVRRYIPNTRTQDWSARPLAYSRTDGDAATTTRVETRLYHTTDSRSMGQTATGRPNQADTYTMTRGTDTSVYEYPHLTGPYHTNLDEGTLDPYDQV